MGTSTHRYPVKSVSLLHSPSELILLKPWCVTALDSFLFFPLGDLLPVMCDRAGFAQDTSLILYEVWMVYFSMISLLLVVWRGILLPVLLALNLSCVMSTAKVTSG